jgi:hypothetical protein
VSSSSRSSPTTTCAPFTPSFSFSRGGVANIRLVARTSYPCSSAVYSGTPGSHLLVHAPNTPRTVRYALYRSGYTSQGAGGRTYLAGGRVARAGTPHPRRPPLH